MKIFATRRMDFQARKAIAANGWAIRSHATRLGVSFTELSRESGIRPARLARILITGNLLLTEYTAIAEALGMDMVQIALTGDLKYQHGV